MMSHLQPCSPDKWEKHGIIIAPSLLDDGIGLENMFSDVSPIGNGRWRIWYSVLGINSQYNIGFAEGSLSGDMERFDAVLTSGEPVDAQLSIGNLPDGWRPVQAVYIKLKDGRHRLYFWAHGCGVVRYLVAESEDGRRYKVLAPYNPVLYHVCDRASMDDPGVFALGLVPSLDKRDPRPEYESPAPAELICNDATNVYMLPDGTFELYTVGLIRVGKEDPSYIAHDNAAGLLRVIDRFTSKDGLLWENRHRVIARDESDPHDQQFYYLSVTHTPYGRIGMLGHYRVIAQTMDIEWCFSDDGVKWWRQLRTPWLKRGTSGEPDCYAIYAPRKLVENDGRWWLFYTGMNYSHNQKDSVGAARSVIMAASCNSIWNVN